MHRIVGMIGIGLFVATLLSMAPAAQALQYGDLTYTSNGSSITITDCSTSATNVVVPATIDNLPVTAIGMNAFKFCSLASIEIPDSVTSIGDSAFWSCGLASIEIPSSVTSIGDSAFRNCVRLANIDVDGANPSFSSLEGVLFNKDQSMLIRYPASKTILDYTIPASATSIDCDAFNVCTNLTSITIPDGVTSIGDSAFSYCSHFAVQKSA